MRLTVDVSAHRFPEKSQKALFREGDDMKRIAGHSLVGFLIFCLLCPSGWSQATAQINGVVKDQSGAVLPGVEINATQTDTGVTRTAITNETGSYILPNLPV